MKKNSSLHFTVGEILDFLTHIRIKKNSVSWVREQTLPMERLPLVGEVSANFCG
jgi:hypothetical protein